MKADLSRTCSARLNRSKDPFSIELSNHPRGSPRMQQQLAQQVPPHAAAIGPAASPINSTSSRWRQLPPEPAAPGYPFVRDIEKDYKDKSDVYVRTSSVGKLYHYRMCSV